jgi:predicted phosphodiesterase
MILGVISDTHGNLALMRKAASLLKNKFLATRIIHLGDDYADKQTLEMDGYPVTGVPGLWCPEYSDPRVPKMVVEEFEGMRIACAHAAEDLPPMTSNLDLCLIGHTHRYGIVVRQGVPLMNPGHLKGDQDRMRLPSFGVVRITNALLCLSIHDLTGQVLMEQEFPRGV